MSDSNPIPANPYSSPRGIGAKDPIVGESNSLQSLTEQIRKTVFWARIVAVIGFVLGGLTFLGGIFGVVAIAMASGSVVAGPGGPQALVMGITYAVCAIVYIVPSALLFGFTNKLREFLNSPNMGNLAVAMQAQTSFWRIIGIMFFALIGLCFLLVAGGFVFGALMAIGR